LPPTWRVLHEFVQKSVTNAVPRPIVTSAGSKFGT
jgi:hypothetical protein